MKHTYADIQKPLDAQVSDIYYFWLDQHEFNSQKEMKLV